MSPVEPVDDDKDTLLEKTEVLLIDAELELANDVADVEDDVSSPVELITLEPPSDALEEAMDVEGSDELVSRELTEVVLGAWVADTLKLDNPDDEYDKGSDDVIEDKISVLDIPLELDSLTLPVLVELNTKPDELGVESNDDDDKVSVDELARGIEDNEESIMLVDCELDAVELIMELPLLELGELDDESTAVELVMPTEDSEVTTDDKPGTAVEVSVALEDEYKAEDETSDPELVMSIVGPEVKMDDTSGGDVEATVEMEDEYEAADAILDPELVNVAFDDELRARKSSDELVTKLDIDVPDELEMSVPEELDKSDEELLSIVAESELKLEWDDDATSTGLLDTS